MARTIRQHSKGAIAGADRRARPLTRVFASCGAGAPNPCRDSRKSERQAHARSSGVSSRHSSSRAGLTPLASSVAPRLRRTCCRPLMDLLNHPEFCCSAASSPQYCVIVPWGLSNRHPKMEQSSATPIKIFPTATVCEGRCSDGDLFSLLRKLCLNSTVSDSPIRIFTQAADISSRAASP
jgi:hypothetical protein